MLHHNLKFRCKINIYMLLRFACNNVHYVPFHTFHDAYRLRFVLRRAGAACLCPRARCMTSHKGRPFARPNAASANWVKLAREHVHRSPLSVTCKLHVQITTLSTRILISFSMSTFMFVYYCRDSFIHLFD